MPLERGQGKTEVKFLLCVTRASLQQGPRLQVLGSAAPGEPLPAALLSGDGAAPVALGNVWVCSLRRKAVVTALLLPGLQPMHQVVPSLFCTVLCRHVLETRRAASPHRAPEGGLCLCFLSLFEPASVPVLVQAGRACSSPVPVLLCCLGAGKQLCCRGVCPCLPVLSVPCPAEGAESLLLLVIVSARLGREFCSVQLLGPSSLPPSLCRHGLCSPALEPDSFPFHKLRGCPIQPCAEGSANKARRSCSSSRKACRERTPLA